MLRVTMLDTETGATESSEIPDGEYVIVATAPCEVVSTEERDGGRVHVIRVVGRIPRPKLYRSNGSH